MERKDNIIAVKIEIEKTQPDDMPLCVKHWFNQCIRKGYDLYDAVTSIEMDADVSDFIEYASFNDLSALWYILKRKEGYVVGFRDIDGTYLLNKLSITGRRPNYSFSYYKGSIDDDTLLFDEKEEAYAIIDYINSSPYLKSFSEDNNIVVMKVVNNEI